LKILQEHQLPKTVLEHVQAVARISCTIAEHLNSRGYRLHLGIVIAASLLHDIVRGEKDHARKASELVARLGYPEVADVIAFHMALGSENRSHINEATIVYLADKLVSGTRVVSLDERLKERLNQFSEEAARQAAKERIGQAMAIQVQIESVLGLKIEDILSEQI
jgi:HD superfamily phosphodiesterase